MDIRPIRSEEDYQAALRTIAELMEAQPEVGTDDFERLDTLATLVEAYERETYPSVRLAANDTQGEAGCLPAG